MGEDSKRTKQAWTVASECAGGGGQLGGPLCLIINTQQWTRLHNAGLAGWAQRPWD